MQEDQHKSQQQDKQNNDKEQQQQSKGSASGETPATADVDSFGSFYDIFEGEETYIQTTYVFDDIPLTLQAYGSHLHTTYLLGQVVWPDAEVLCHWIVLNKHLFKDKSVLEVGAGPGLAGLLAAHYCKRVVLTDLDDKVLNLLQMNAAKAGLSNVDVYKLAWGEKVDEFIEKFGPFDIVIGSGIVYEENCVAPLLETVSKALAPYRPAEGTSRAIEEEGGSDESALVEKDGDGVFIMANFTFRWDKYFHVLKPASERLKLSRKLVPMDTLLRVAKEKESERKMKSTINDKNFGDHNICVMRLL